MKTRPVTLGLALVAAAGATGVRSAPVDVHLRAASSIAHAGAVLLGDLATIRGTDLATVRALTQFPLPAPVRPGISRRYTRRDIERLVARAVAVDRVRWLGADAVAVQPQGIEVPGAALEQTARIGLLALLAPHGRYRVQSIRPVEPVIIPPGQLTVRVRPVTVEPRRTSQSVAVDLLVDGALIRSTTLSFQVQQLQASTGEAQPLPVDSSRTADRVVPVAVASPVRTVVRGQQVSILTRAGMLHIEGPGEALEDGASGQSVEVRTGAGVNVRARVLAPGRVEVAP